MESDTRDTRRAGTGQGRAMNGEKSPAGSVKRARQRAAAVLPPDRPQMPLYPTPLSTKSPRRSPPKVPSPNGRTKYSQYSPPGSIQAPKDPQSIPLAPIRPQKGPPKPTSPQEYAGRGPPPQRPPRPNHVPPMFQSSNVKNNRAPNPQIPIPPAPEQPFRNYWEDSYLDSSSSSRPVTNSSTGTGSSIGSIPDFPSTPSIPPVPPIPQIPSYQPPPRRNLGPPPSARRGGPSYYSPTSFVPPIPEEISESRSSIASSHLPPEGWGDGPPEYYMGGGISEEDEDEIPPSNSGRESRAGDHDESTGLVREGSRNNPRMPFLDTVESGDESDRGNSMRELDWQATQDKRFRPAFGGAVGTDAIGRHNFRGNGRLQPYSGYESDLSFLESPGSRSPLSKSITGPIVSDANPYFDSKTPSSGESPLDSRVNQILGHLEKGGALASSGTASPSTASSEKGLKRPPRLNLDGSKEGVGRGSATSLPELIRRATRLASNLDRGKTASRIGVLDMLNAKDKENKDRTAKDSHPASISDIIASFPSPSPTTLNGQRPSGWPSPSPHGRSALSRRHTATYGSSSTQRHRSRKFCGMPVWAFILLLIIFLLLIAAAVIIPVTLVVLPREHKDNTPDLASCKSSNPCAHGGSNVIIGGHCGCVCANGFAKAGCTEPADSDCITSDVPGADAISTYKNATLGSSISRLLAAAQSNFTIPLTSYTILALFNINNLTCSSENALVTLNQKSQRRDLPALFLPDGTHLHQEPVPLALDQLIGSPTKSHNHASRILHGRGGEQTANSIIFAAPSGDAPPATATNSPPSSSATSSTNTKPITQQVLDFARTAVLFVFQETSNLNTATTAMEKLQTTLSNGKTFDASQTSAGGNVTIDLSALTVGFGNGTLFGGKGS